MDFDITYNPNDLNIGKIIGKGANGDVYLATSKNDEHKYALKFLNLYKDEKFQTLFFRETLIMHKLNYPSIVKLYGINLQDSNDSTLFKPSILTEYMPNKSLGKALKNWKNKKPAKFWTPTCRYKTILGIAYGMRYLHRNHIIHRDLKPDNILLNGNYEPCICDFGLSRYYSNTDMVEMTKGVGTPLYMAPELINCDGKHYTDAVDVYSFSLIVYEIITGQNLFEKIPDGHYKFFKFILKGNRPNLELESISEKMKNFLELCWNKNPEKRLSFDEICDLLSNDFSYIKENVDEKEIKRYISVLESAQKNEPFQIYPNENNTTYLKFLDTLISKIPNFSEMQAENILYF